MTSFYSLCRITVHTVVGVCVLGMVLGMFPVSAEAQAKPFGGMVNYRRDCDCSIGWWVRIGPPMGGNFHYIGPQDFREFNFPSVGTWSLGLYFPGGACFIQTGDSCTRLPTKGVINGFVGSSQ